MVIGHQKNLDDLKRMVQSETLGQSYLFCGPSMIGKRMAAWSFAKFLEKGIFEPPHEGEVLQDATVVDLDFMRQIDRTVTDSIGIAASREIKNFLFQKPLVSLRRTLIIDDAELLTTEAQNALLKIIEEPPASSLIIFIVSDPDAIVPTILSRVQKVYFGVVPVAEIADWLIQEHSVPKTKALDAAKRSLGKPGLAWKIIFDEKFGDDIALAEKFLRTSSAERRDFIKELIAPEDFILRAFLESVVLVLSWDPSFAKKNPELWHKALALYDAATNFGLNPRLQLEGLLV